MLSHKKTLKKDQTSLTILYSLSFILAVSSALPAYIQSNFLAQFVSVKFISLFFVIANFLSIVAIIYFPFWIERLGNYFLTKIILTLYFVSLIGLSLANSPLIALISTIIFTVTTYLIWINMDILLESFSSNSSTGKTRTIYLTMANLAWIISPFLSSYLIGKGAYALSFLTAATIVVPFYIIFTKEGKKLKKKTNYKHERLKETLNKMWRNKNLRGIFFISFLLQLFYSSAVIYIPFHLLHNFGMDWHTLGIVFSIMLIPFVLVEYPAGIIADKILGEKEMLFTGFVILIISLFLFFYLNTASVIIWTIVLFFSRIGAALVQAMQETYFFKIIDVEDVEIINIFRTSSPLAYTIGPSIAILILYFFPLQYLFLFLSMIMLSGFMFVASIKDTK